MSGGAGIVSDAIRWIRIKSNSLTCLSILLLAAAGIPSTAAALTSNYTYATSFSNQRSIVWASTGTVVLFYQKGSPATSGNGLHMAISRDGGQSWATSTQVAAVPKVFADAYISANNDIYLVYSTNEDAAGSTNDVRFMKLPYNAVTDDWSVGPTVMVYDASSNTGAFNAVIAHDDNYLWVAYRFIQSNDYSIRLRYSADGGLTWQDGPPADTPGPNADETAAFITFGGKLGLIYYHQDSEFWWRWRLLSDPPASWSSSELIYHLPSGTFSKSGYSILTDDHDRIHLIYERKGINHLVYSGAAWTPTPTVVSTSGIFPEVVSNGSDMWAVWQLPIGTAQFDMVARRYDTSTQQWDAVTHTLTGPSQAFLSRVWCYSSGNHSYADVTTAAGNVTTKDIRNPSTLAMLKKAGDILYLGESAPYNYLRIQLGVNGSGGSVAWEYWNGRGWSGFTPSSGSYSFPTTASVQLWPDGVGPPADWAATTVQDAAPRFYVRARALTAFATQAPVGTQITSFKQNRYPAALAHDPNRLVVAWTQGLGSPYTIATRSVAWAALGATPQAVQPSPPVDVTAVSDEENSSPSVPGALWQNAPNPFNPATTIRFRLSRDERARLSVFDIQGRLVRVLADGYLPAGEHFVSWDGRDDGGRNLASGVYFYRLSAEDFSVGRRMVMLR